MIASACQARLSLTRGWGHALRATHMRGGCGCRARNARARACVEALALHHQPHFLLALLHGDAAVVLLAAVHNRARGNQLVARGDAALARRGALGQHLHDVDVHRLPVLL